MAGACFLGRKFPRDGALGCMRHGGEGSGGGGSRHLEPGYQLPNLGFHRGPAPYVMANARYARSGRSRFGGWTETRPPWARKAPPEVGAAPGWSSLPVCSANGVCSPNGEIGDLCSPNDICPFFKVESDFFLDYTFASHTSQNICLLNTCIRREIMRLEPLISSGAYQNVTLRS